MKQELDLREDKAFDHEVPLSAAAVEVLRTMRPFSSQKGPIFPGARDMLEPLSENAVGYLYNREGWRDRHVPHGWRSSFSTIMNSRIERSLPGAERLLVDRLIIDLMLAHTPSGMSETELIYNRAAYMERRRELAEDWASLILEGADPVSKLLEGRRRRVELWTSELGPDNAFWDGEWISWDEIDEQIQHKEWRARFPNADLSVVSIFETLMSTAEHYHEITGRHLQVYGDIGELYGCITHGLKLHRNYAQGSDGRIGNDLVEVKTITPFKSNGRVTLNLDRNFSKVLIVKISADFEIASRMFDRKDLPRVRGSRLALDWNAFAGA